MRSFRHTNHERNTNKHRLLISTTNLPRSSSEPLQRTLVFDHMKYIEVPGWSQRELLSAAASFVVWLLSCCLLRISEFCLNKGDKMLNDPNTPINNGASGRLRTSEDWSVADCKMAVEADCAINLVSIIEHNAWWYIFKNTECNYIQRFIHFITFHVFN